MEAVYIEAHGRPRSLDLRGNARSPKRPSVR